MQLAILLALFFPAVFADTEVTTFSVSAEADEFGVDNFSAGWYEKTHGLCSISNF